MHKKTKLIATLGPASASEDIIKQLLENGADVFRLNFSHGDHEEKIQKIKIVRQLSSQMGKYTAIIADLAGPKLRLGDLASPIKVSTGDEVILSPQPAMGIPMQFDLTPHLKPSDRIFINDGLLELKVTTVENGQIITTAQNDGVLSSRKGINIPDTSLKTSAFTQKDEQDAIFAIENGADYLAMSFIEHPDDLLPLRKILEQKKSKAKVIAKIERRLALENLTGIIAASDGVMVARGDLASETSPVEVPMWQQEIVRLSRQQQKPVIIATQMLESMTVNPRPTRAEVSDVANAVLIQSDAVMLSGESASGKYPIEAVKIMNDTIVTVEKNYEKFKTRIKINWEEIPVNDLPFNSITSSAATIAFRIGASAIIAATATGKTAKALSSFRPSNPIIGVAHDDIIARQMNLVWGVLPMVVEGGKTTDQFLNEIILKLEEKYIVKKMDTVVAVSGSANIGDPGSTDLVRIIRIQ